MYDHCDRCGATGKARALLESGKELVFCGHHAHEFRNAVEDKGGVIVMDDAEEHQLEKV